MTLRLSVCILILLMATLISLQHPLTVLNSGESQIPSSDLEVQQYKAKGGRNFHVMQKRQAVKNVEAEKQNHNQCTEMKTEKKKNQGKKRKKRLETEEEGIERNQFYKSVNEETKQDIDMDNSKKITVGGWNPNFVGDLKSPVKINVANIVRPARQAADVMNTQPNNEWVFRGGNKDSEEVKEKSNGGGFLQSLKTSTGHRRERECLEVPELGDIQRFSPDTLETMKKINPLTIGDQVSQMIHDRNCNTKNKLMSKSVIGSAPGPLQNEAQVADLSSGVSHDTDDTALRQAAAYEKQQSSKGVQKQCPNNDYGFSVIILAGDPLKIGGSGARSETEGKEEKSLKKKQKDCFVDNTEGQPKDINQINVNNLNRFSEHFPNKELYVPKTFDPNVNFPVYDEDLTFIPDPFNGLLEEDQSVEQVNKEDNRLLVGGAQKKSAHMIHVRGIQKKNSNKNAANNGVRNGNGVNNGIRNGNGANNKAKTENLGNNKSKNINNGNNGSKNIKNANNGVKNGNSGDTCVTLGIMNICDNNKNSTTKKVRCQNNGDKNGNSVDTCVTLGIMNICDNNKNSTTTKVRCQNNRDKNGKMGSNNANICNDSSNSTNVGNIEDSGDDSTKCTTNETITETVTTPSLMDLTDCDSGIFRDATSPENDTIDNIQVGDEPATSEKMASTPAATDLQSDEATPPEIESFGDLVINLNDTSCQSWGKYNNNTDGNINNRNVRNNNNKGEIETKVFYH